MENPTVCLKNNGPHHIYYKSSCLNDSLSKNLSRARHTGVDEKGIFMSIRSHVETWWDNWKLAVLLEKDMVAEEGLEPPTRGL